MIILTGEITLQLKITKESTVLYTATCIFGSHFEKKYLIERIYLAIRLN